MKISVLTKKSKSVKDFDKTQWKKWDKVHFGKEIEWKTVFYYLSAKEGSAIVGTMEVKIEAGVGKVNTLIVHSESLRKGIGKALMRKAEELTKKHNGHKLILTTGKGWEAVKFYKELGFQEVGLLRDHFFHVDFIEMNKLLE
ncbi:hypothetical protein COT62_00900 [Candidatus Roizmanbacteria bacterium CG09_land_8_20_14_0_10_41_9]|uniref:N-acetyltransferase domain-containing protein n=1 Tax=Candidatus Roizmanbacteria bacterium CG09_land_8_20_14_0_10_41_9 TaxID=1974850 RepID=A0A2H0WTH2_9BACT|nr:MAG: hypothetical protein COT62_00900 [Candidatus Roizmanbacteria bacterium CG09_land_8_20_14_0_10_41_9]